MSIDKQAMALFPALKLEVAHVMTSGQLRAAEISLNAGEGP
ncbi:hypothetical protein [Bifidobacterium aquikefiricola]|uniref:Uncharacterized protein n=1 Tax=Bifidobacterium aquikefiricola TaxID=3059038 RepID=A0AB39U815_9BIFI